MSAGCSSTGGVVEITMENDLWSENTPSPTATLPEVGPMSVGIGGARWTLPVADPDPGSVVVTVMYAGPKVFENVSGSPSASVAWRGWSAVAPGSTLIADGDASTGATPLTAVARTAEDAASSTVEASADEERAHEARLSNN